MKKVLVAGAALMLAGSIVTAASAEVTLSGDARVRYIGQSDYQRGAVSNLDGTFTEKTNGYYDEFDSRIRVKFDAKAKGGAYMKARVRFDDFSQWDGQGWGMYSDDKNVWADYAYIGIPMGAVTIDGGRMPANFSKFFSWDGRPTRVKATYKGGGVKIIGLVDVVDENTDNPLDEWDDNDFMAYGLVASMKMGDNWTLKGYARYHDDAREWNQATTDVNMTTINEDDGTPSGTYTVQGVPILGGYTPHADRSGFLGSVNLAGKAGTIGIEAEVAYKSADVQGKADDGLGAFATVSMDMGAFTPSFTLGMTQDGYVADPDFGYIMIGADEPITVVNVGNGAGDFMWGAFSAAFAVSDQFRLTGNLVYASYDGEEVDRLADAIEVSGSATYVVSEGAELTYKIGVLAPSYDGRANAIGMTDDAYFGQYLRMAIKF